LPIEEDKKWRAPGMLQNAQQEHPAIVMRGTRVRSVLSMAQQNGSATK